MSDVLAVGAHPDDVEIWAGGLVAKAAQAGCQVAILDLTRGELGTRGSAETRAAEAAAAAEALGVASRENLDLPDGDVQPAPSNQRRLAGVLRRLRPRLVLAPYELDRHPDHERASALVREAAWSAGLEKFETPDAPGAEPHRPRVLYYMGWHSFEPTLVVDITDVYERKLAAVRCYASQLHGSETGERRTRLSDEKFIEQWTARQLYFGSLIGVRYGEPYYARGPLPIGDPALLWAQIWDET